MPKLNGNLIIHFQNHPFSKNLMEIGSSICLSKYPTWDSWDFSPPHLTWTMRFKTDALNQLYQINQINQIYQIFQIFQIFQIHQIHQIYQIYTTSMIVLAKDLTLWGPRFDTKFTAATQNPKLWGGVSAHIFHTISMPPLTKQGDILGLIGVRGELKNMVLFGNFSQQTFLGQKYPSNPPKNCKRPTYFVKFPNNPVILLVLSLFCGSRWKRWTFPQCLLSLRSSLHE